MALLSTIVVFGGLFTSRALVDPPPVKYEEGRNADQVYAAVLDAASQNGWRSKPIDSANISATFQRSVHVVVVQITVSSDSVSLKYQSSKNLDFQRDSGGERIHKAYMEWSAELMNSIRRRLQNLCPDLTRIRETQFIGWPSDKVMGAFPGARTVENEIEVRASTGARTGYVVREHSGYLQGSGQDCSPISLVYFTDKLVSVFGAKAEPTALIAYTDVLNYLVERNQISFSDSELERMSLKLDIVSELDAPRREELLRYVEWQAQRFEKNEISQKEYSYLLAQKEAEVGERQGAIDRNEEELGVLKQQARIQSASLTVQQEQLAAQRSMAISQALSNLAKSYQPTIQSTHCQSRAIGNTVYTDCR